MLAVLHRNREQLVVDGAVLLTWILVTATLFRWLTLPQWLHYLVLFAGVAVYSRLTPDWERPVHSQD